MTVVTAQQATAAANQALRDLNAKQIAQIPENIKRLAEAQPIYLFNLRNQRHQVELGSLGCWSIQPCAKGEEYSTPTIIPAIVFEAIPTDMKSMEHRQWAGIDVADDILGIGPFKSAQNDKRRWGVFKSFHNPPLKEEVEAARALLNKTYLELCDEAQAIYNEGPGEYKNITALHREAARETNQDFPWCQTAKQMAKCESCGQPVDPDAALHTGKGWEHPANIEKAVSLGLWKLPKKQ